MVTTLIDAHETHRPGVGTTAAPVARQHPRRAQLLLREALGIALRGFRADVGLTLRELAEMSRVSPGYLSELERGRKEVSSELLASVCRALHVSVADVLIEAATTMALTESGGDLNAELDSELARESAVGRVA
ncbi:MAG: helix-turn-helix transcriptional regulator [Corynebacterium sp.]|nr:helix-turn-helix transcriptional regulator [Corynebacterium sp.]